MNDEAMGAAAVDAVDGEADAGACGDEADRVGIEVGRRGSCVVLRVACDADGANLCAPALLSPAASRALAAELMAAADAVEPAAQD